MREAGGGIIFLLRSRPTTFTSSQPLKWTARCLCNVHCVLYVMLCGLYIYVIFFATCDGLHYRNASHRLANATNCTLANTTQCMTSSALGPLCLPPCSRFGHFAGLEWVGTDGDSFQCAHAWRRIPQFGTASFSTPNLCYRYTLGGALPNDILEPDTARIQVSET